MNDNTRANATTTAEAGAQYVKARLNEILGRQGFKVQWSSIFGRDTLIPTTPTKQDIYRFGRDAAYAYGVPPWLVDPQYDTRAEHWRWRWHQLTRPWRWLKRKRRGLTSRA